MALDNLTILPDLSNARNQSGSVNSRVIAQNTAESIAIPAGAKRVIIAATADICFSMTGTAVVPSDSDTGAMSELIPYGVPIQSRTFLIPSGATALSVITPATAGAGVTASFYSL